MKRKRITVLFPFLLPIRVKQKRFCLYAKMFFDKNKYSSQRNDEKLENLIFTDRSILINKNTGMDIIYQYNKVDNLKLAAKTIDGLLIKPNETFSFWWLVRNAEKYGKYKEGLVDKDDTLVAEKGGGLCQMSNAIFWTFLHSDLKIIERHEHGKMDFPYPDCDVPEGTDATVSEGWLDLMLKNYSDKTYQLFIDFDDENIITSLYSDKPSKVSYNIVSKNGSYFKKNDAVFRTCSIYKEEIDIKSNLIIKNEHLYDNICEIGYNVEE